MVTMIPLNGTGNCTMEHIRTLMKENKNNNEAGDATWILTSAFIIFTMQSGFGLLEAGSVSVKNECNIMIKNAADVIFGSLGYWLCGFAFSYGNDPKWANEFTGFGYFLTDDNTDDFGFLYAKYFFQLSFATTATTIVSGAMAERTNLKAYMLFSFLNFLSYVFPAHWIWDDNGFLHKLGVVDVAGCGPVHLVGGVSAIVATIMLKPRHGIFNKHAKPQIMASPTNVVLGTFMLWWGWLGFNCGSTFGVSGGKWKLASRAAVATVNGSVGGGLWAILYSYKLCKKFKGKLDVGTFSTGVLGGLVSVTAICAVCRPWEALLIGFIGGIITCYGARLVELLKIDDPVICIPVHCFCGIWGMLAVGLFAEKDGYENISNEYGIIKGGKASFFGYQCLAVICIIGWSAVATSIELFITDKIFGLRVTLEDELIGADAAEHGIGLDEPLERFNRTRILGSVKKYEVNNYNSQEVSEYNTYNMTSSQNNGILNFGYVSINENQYKDICRSDASCLYDSNTESLKNLDSSYTINISDAEINNSQGQIELQANSKKEMYRSKSLTELPSEFPNRKRLSTRSYNFKM